jgi:hypothetical protein
MSKRRIKLNSLVFGTCARVEANPSMDGPAKDGRQACVDCAPYRVVNDPYARYMQTIANLVLSAMRR